MLINKVTEFLSCGISKLRVILIGLLILFHILPDLILPNKRLSIKLFKTLSIKANIIPKRNGEKTFII